MESDQLRQLLDSYISCTSQLIPHLAGQAAQLLKGLADPNASKVIHNLQNSLDLARSTLLQGATYKAASILAHVNGILHQFTRDMYTMNT